MNPGVPAEPVMKKPMAKPAMVPKIEVSHVPTMHMGGPVMKDGTYNLKKGAHVLTGPEAMQARKHALMASGMKSLAKGPMTKGQPTVVDLAHKKPEKKMTKGITVRPEMNQAAPIKDMTKK